MASPASESIIAPVSHGRFNSPDRSDGRVGKRRAWQARLFPQLTEPLEDAQARPLPRQTINAAGLGRYRPPTERADLDAVPPRLTPHGRDWLDALGSAETRRAYRRDAAFLMRRLAADTDPKLAALGRGDAERYRDLLQGLVDAGDASAGLARRRMAAALSLFDHLHRRYLVLVNPFAKLRRPREGGADAPAAYRPRRACGRSGCPLAVLGSGAAAGAVIGLPPRRRPARRGAAADGPHQLRLW